MSALIEEKSGFFDTHHRYRKTSKSSNDCEFYLNNQESYKYAKFKQLVIRHSWYPFLLTDTLLYKEATTNRSDTISEPSSWTGAAIATALQTTLNTTGDSDFTVTYSSVTGKFTFTKGSGEFTFRFSAMTNNFWKVMGFPEGVDVVSSSSTLTSTNIAVVFGYENVYIRSSKLSSINSAFSAGQAYNTAETRLQPNRNVIMSVPADSDFGEVIKVTEDQYNKVFKLTDDRITSIDFQITDKDGDLMQLNGSEWIIQFDLY